MPKLAAPERPCAICRRTPVYGSRSTCSVCAALYQSLRNSRGEVVSYAELRKCLDEAGGDIDKLSPDEFPLSDRLKARWRSNHLKGWSCKEMAALPPAKPKAKPVRKEDLLKSRVNPAPRAVSNSEGHYVRDSLSYTTEWCTIEDFKKMLEGWDRYNARLRWD